MLLPFLFGLVLYFDGSLRPPRDSNFSTQGLGRMASCGAALYDDNDNHVAIGGKALEIIPETNSADVEYDGLLFGLKKCFDDELWKNDDTLVIVRGDCKAIIDQLNGKAAPRKLLTKHELVLSLLESIGKQVSFQHVPRKENVLCDSTCAALMNILEQRQVSKICENLAFLSQSANTDQSRCELLVLLKDFVMSEKSLVRYSIRPKMYLKVAEVARRFNDGAALELIGRQLVDEAKLWKANGAINKELMTAQGILWQMQGLELMDNDKQVRRLRRKHRFILDRFATHDTIIDTFKVACSSIHDSDNPSFLFHDLDDNDCQSLHTWYYEACKQEDSTLHQGYWINR